VYEMMHSTIHWIEELENIKLFGGGIIPENNLFFLNSHFSSWCFKKINYSYQFYLIFLPTYFGLFSLLFSLVFFIFCFFKVFTPTTYTQCMSVGTSYWWMLFLLWPCIKWLQSGWLQWIANGQQWNRMNATLFFMEFVAMASRIRNMSRYEMVVAYMKN